MTHLGGGLTKQGGNNVPKILEVTKSGKSHMISAIISGAVSSECPTSNRCSYLPCAQVLLKLLKGLGHENCGTAINGLKVRKDLWDGRCGSEWLQGSCHLYCLESAVQVLAHLREKPVDLVLIDVEMPGMDGLKATERLRVWCSGLWLLCACEGVCRIGLFLGRRVSSNFSIGHER